jgi:hypothetical protein
MDPIQSRRGGNGLDPLFASVRSALRLFVHGIHVIHVRHPSSPPRYTLSDRIYSRLDLTVQATASPLMATAVGEALVEFSR